MKDYLISQFIDNELDLDEKVEFVETVYDDKGFKDETVELLVQEKMLQADMVTTLPAVRINVKGRATRNFFKPWLPPFAGFATAMALVAMVFLFRPEQVVSHENLHRFVIYRPGAGQTEIMGTFTGWAPVPMQKIGTSGYWSLTLSVPEGEHRYSYLVENGQQIADPTVLIRERDDFGGENSIIKVEVAI